MSEETLSSYAYADASELEPLAFPTSGDQIGPSGGYIGFFFAPGSDTSVTDPETETLDPDDKG